MKSFSAIALLSILCIAHGFVAPAPTFAKTGLAALAGDEDDFDAPADRAASVGNIIRSENKFFMGVEVPSFLSNMFNKGDSAGGKARFEVADIDDMAMDDECYLGKYGQMNECADFDP